VLGFQWAPIQKKSRQNLCTAPTTPRAETRQNVTGRPLQDLPIFPPSCLENVDQRTSERFRDTPSHDPPGCVSCYLTLIRQRRIFFSARKVICKGISPPSSERVLFIAVTVLFCGPGPDTAQYPMMGLVLWLECWYQE
jgi:hypothetical protein